MADRYLSPIVAWTRSQGFESAEKAARQAKRVLDLWWTDPETPLYRVELRPWMLREAKRIHSLFEDRACAKQAEALATATPAGPSNRLLAALMNQEGYRPGPPLTLTDAGLSESLVDSLICKYLLIKGRGSGRTISN